MTDRRLRDQERAAQSGDPQAEARLLTERVRAGELPTASLHLAARLGHPAARLALPQVKRAGNPLRELDQLGLPAVQMAVRRVIVDHVRTMWQAHGTISDPVLAMYEDSDDEREELEVGDAIIPSTVIETLRVFAETARDERDSSRLRDVMRLYPFESVASAPLVLTGYDLIMLCANHRPFTTAVRGLSLLLLACGRGDDRTCNRIAKQQILDAAYEEILAPSKEDR